MDDEYFEVAVEEAGGEVTVAPVATPARTAAAPPPKPAAKTVEAPQPASLEKGEVAINAPMPGMIIEYKVKEGDKVKSGDVVLILEAMKMENSLTAPATGTIKKIALKAGSSVAKDETLCVIATEA